MRRAGPDPIAKYGSGACCSMVIAIGELVFKPIPLRERVVDWRATTCRSLAACRCSITRSAFA